MRASKVLQWQYSMSVVPFCPSFTTVKDGQKGTTDSEYWRKIIFQHRKICVRGSYIRKFPAEDFTYLRTRACIHLQERACARTLHRIFAAIKQPTRRRVIELRQWWERKMAGPFVNFNAENFRSDIFRSPRDWLLSYLDPRVSILQK